VYLSVCTGMRVGLMCVGMCVSVFENVFVANVFLIYRITTLPCCDVLCCARFVMEHVMTTRGVSGWSHCAFMHLGLANFRHAAILHNGAVLREHTQSSQTKWLWSASFQSFFVQAIYRFLTFQADRAGQNSVGARAKRSNKNDVVGRQVGFGGRDDSAAYANLPEDVLGGDSWTVVDKAMVLALENDDVSWNSTLNESDLLTMLEGFPVLEYLAQRLDRAFEQVASVSASDSKHSSSSPSSSSEPVVVAELVSAVAMCQAMATRLFRSAKSLATTYSSLVRHLAKMICDINELVAARFLHAVGARDTAHGSSDAHVHVGLLAADAPCSLGWGVRVFMQSALDDLVVRTLSYLHHLSTGVGSTAGMYSV
jgi:hypothetical protein